MRAQSLLLPDSPAEEFAGSILSLVKRLSAVPARVELPAPDLAALSSLSAVLNARLDERAVLDGAVNMSVDNVTPITLFRAAGTIPIGKDFSGSPQLTTMIVTLDLVSGEGRYQVGGMAPSPTTGLSIPSGGGTFTVHGMFNIQTFTIIATTATPLKVACQIFSRASYYARG